jgi:hypothetical protein
MPIGGNRLLAVLRGDVPAADRRGPSGRSDSERTGARDPNRPLAELSRAATDGAKEAILAGRTGSDPFRARS